MNGTTVGTLLTDLLQTCADAYAIITGAPTVPARRFVSFGEPPPYEGDLLAVWWAGLRTVKPFPQTQASAAFAAVMPATDLNFMVMRSCWPSANVTTSASTKLPKPADIQAAALAVTADAATLMAHLSDVAVKGGMFPTLPTIRDGDIALQPLVPVTPSGLRVGVRGVVQVKLAIL